MGLFGTSLQIWHSLSQFCYQFGINSSLMAAFIVEDIGENLAFFVGKTDYSWQFE